MTTIEEDYINGTKLMIKAYKKKNYSSFRKCMWLIQLNKLLSQKKVCYDFWRNIINSRNEVKFLTTPRDNMLLFDSSCSFIWGTAKFPENQNNNMFNFWSRICAKIVTNFNDNNYRSISKK